MHLDPEDLYDRLGQIRQDDKSWHINISGCDGSGIGPGICSLWSLYSECTINEHNTMIQYLDLHARVTAYNTPLMSIVY